MLIDKKSRLHLLINGEDLGPIAQAIPARRFAVLDLYGCCEEVSIVTADHGERGRVCMEETKAERSSGRGALHVDFTIVSSVSWIWDVNNWPSLISKGKWRHTYKERPYWTWA